MQFFFVAVCEKKNCVEGLGSRLVRSRVWVHWVRVHWARGAIATITSITSWYERTYTYTAYWSAGCLASTLSHPMLPFKQIQAVSLLVVIATHTSLYIAAYQQVPMSRLPD